MSYHTLTRSAPPSTPATDKSTLFVDLDRRLKLLDDRGILTDLKLGGDRNFVTNGGFSVKQRVAAALTNIAGASATARIFTADHWGVTVGNVTTPQFQWVDAITAPETGLQTRYYGRFKQLTNAAKHAYSNVVMGTETALLRGRVVRVQAKLRASVGANRTLRLGLVQLNNAGTVDTFPASFIPAFNGAGSDPTLGTNLAYIAPSTDGLENATVSGNALSCAITNSWQRFGGVFTVPSDCRNLCVLIWTDATLAANDENCVAEVGLYDGKAIEDYMSLPFAMELARCQRFFCKTFSYATVPVTNAGLNTGEHKWVKVVAGATASRSTEWQFPVTMRATPTTVTLYNPAVANAQVRDETNTVDCSASAAAGTSDRQTAVTCTGNAATVAEGLLGVHLSADAEI